MATVMATVEERAGFEPADPFESPVFKLETGALGVCAEYNVVVHSRPESDGNSDGSPKEEITPGDERDMASQIIAAVGSKYTGGYVVIHVYEDGRVYIERDLPEKEAKGFVRTAIQRWNTYRYVTALKRFVDPFDPEVERRMKKPPSAALELRYRVLQRDGFRCTYCGATAEQARLHVDHVIPRAKGGLSTMENLTTACEACNLGKKDWLPDEPSRAA